MSYFDDFEDFDKDMFDMFDAIENTDSENESCEALHNVTENLYNDYIKVCNENDKLKKRIKVLEDILKNKEKL